MSTGGLSKARLGRMHDVMAGYVERSDVPGLVTLVSRRGEVHVDAIGTKAAGGGDPMRRDTIFRIASMTKPITAAAAMILVEECKLRLDEPVDRLLPELANRKVLKRLDGPLDDTVPANRPISVRDLLTFRLGIGAVMAPPGRYPMQTAMAAAGLAPGPNPPSHAPDDWMKRLGGLPLIHQPGERWMYHTGSDVLGVLIARAAGQPLESFFRERIFEPLGMKDTGFHVPAEKLDRLPPTYTADVATGTLAVHDDPADSRWGRPPAFPAGGGGLVSTVDDYLAFCLARAHSVAAVGRAHDHRPSDAGAEGGSGHLLRGQPRLGLRHGRRHPARRSIGGSRTVRLGRRPRHLRLFGPDGRPGRNPDDPATHGFPRRAPRLSRFLDLDVPSNRRLRRRHDVAGFWIIQVKSKAEAIEWASPVPFGEGEELEVLWEKEVDAQRVSEAAFCQSTRGFT